MNQNLKDKDDDIHTVPNNGKHIDSLNCWCEPELYYQDEMTGIRCFSHKSDEETKQ